MPSLSEILKDPNYLNANDATKQAIFNKYSALDPNFANANAATQDAIRQRFGVMASEPLAPALPTKAPTAPTTLRDIGVAGASGVVGATKALTDVFGADNVVSRKLGEASTGLQEMYTPERQREMQYYQNLQDQAAKSGDVLGEVGAAFQGIKAAPLQGTVQAVGSLIPNLATLFIPGAGQARALQISRGAVNTAIGIVQGTGAVKGAIYEGVKQELIKEGVDEATANQKASEAQSYLGKNADQILLGAAIGYGAGKVGAEQFLTPGAGGATRKLATIGAEAGTEAMQGGQEQVAQNLALQRQGFDAPTFQGVAGAATQEGILGGLGAGTLSLASRRPSQAEVPDAKPVTEAQIPLLLEGKGAFVPVGLPDGSVAMTREDLARYEEEQFRKKYAPQDVERERLRLGYDPFTPKVTSAGTVAMTAEDVKRAEEQDFQRKYAPVPFTPEEIQENILRERAGLPPIEEKFAPVIPKDILEEQRREAKEAKGAKKTKSEIDQLEAEARKIEADIAANTTGKLSGKSLRQALLGKLIPSEVKDISPEKSFGALRAKYRGTTVADMIEDGDLNDWLPQEMRPGSELFDPQESAEYIKDKIRNKDFKEAGPQIAAKLLGRELDALQERINQLKAPQEGRARLAELSPEEVQAETDRLAREAGYLGQPRAEEVLQPIAPAAEPVVDEYVPDMDEATLSAETQAATEEAAASSVDQYVNANNYFQQLAQLYGQMQEQIQATPDEAPAKQELMVRADQIAQAAQAAQRNRDAAASAMSDRQRAEVGLPPAGGPVAQQAPGAPEQLAGPQPSTAVSAAETDIIEGQAREVREPGKYMQAKPNEKGMTKAAVDRAVDAIKSTWKNAPDIEVVQNISELPAEIQEDIARDKVNPRGVYDPTTKKVFLVADNIPNDAQAAITLAHESLGHFGLRVVLGQNFKPMMNQIYEGNKNVRDRADAYMEEGLDRETAVEEVLSEMAQEVYDTRVPENKNKLTALQKVMNVVRQFLARIGVPMKSISDAQVLMLIANARRSVVKGGQFVDMGGGKALYSAGTSSNFKKWFGDSKVVDENGEPLVVYHGTNANIEEFWKKYAGSNTLNYGMYGKAPGYFSRNTLEASGYAVGNPDRKLYAEDQTRPNFIDTPSGKIKEGANVMPVYISIQNPLRVDSHTALDKFIRDVSRTGKFGSSSVTNILKALGYDGVIVDNGEEIVPFKPTQIKSVFNRGTFDPKDKRILYSEGMSSNLRRWFGDSKIVNKDGSPMVVYHGTTADIEEFKVSKEGGSLGNGIYLTPETEFAGSYADKKGGNVMPLYASIKNPLVIDGSIRRDPMIEALVKLGVDLAKAEKIVEKALDDKGYITNEVKSRAVAQGYDGITQFKDGKLSEIVAFNPTQVKSVFNKGEFSPTSKKVLYSARERMERVAKRMSSKRPEMQKDAFDGVDEGFVSKLGDIFFPENKTIFDRINGMRDNFFQKLAQGVADQYRTIKDYTPEGYMLARMSKTIDGALEGLLFNGQVTLTDGALDIKQGTQGLFKVMEPVGKEVDRFQIWMALNRDAQLVRQGKAPSVDPKLVARVSELEKGKIGNKSRLEVYEQVRRDMNALNKSVLNIARKQGLIDDAAYEIFSNDINYIPFYKAMEDGDVQGAATASGLARQEFSKQLKGGEKPFGDLMENTLRNWSHILSASMKNKAANVTVDAAMDMGAAYPNLKVGLEWRDGKVYSTKSGQMAGDGKLKAEYTTQKAGMVKTMIDGKPAYFEIVDPLLLESISSIGYMGPKSKFLDVAKDFKNILQFGVTLSPAFKVRNLFRDSISAMAVSDLERSPLANVYKGWLASDKNNPAHISALAGGAIFNFGSAYEGDQSRMIKRLLKQGVSRDSILDTDEKIKKGIADAWRKYQEWGNKSESANRMALYQQMRDRGMSHLEASFYARDLLDFSMQGSWPAFRLVAQTVPFLNARVQGLYKLGRDGIVPTSRVIYNTATGKPIEATDKQKAQQFSTVTSAVVLASMALYLMFKDDDEFKKREAWDRDNFWWFKLPGMETALRVPKPFEIGAFGTMSERVLEQIIDQGAEGKQFEESFRRMLGDTFALNPTPQVIKPLLDLYANKDSFTGAPIETAGMERLSKQERASDSTSPIAIALGGISNILSKVTGEKTELSPVQIDYAIKAYLGWLGGTISSTSHYAVMPFSKSAYPDHNWTDTMSLGFVKSLPATQSRYVTEFYQNSKQISQAYADMRHYAELGEADKVNQILEEKGDQIALAKSYDKAAKDMSRVRQVISAIRADETISGAEKKEEIDRLKLLIGEIAQQMEDVRRSLKN
jgi:hypothetical protein